MFQKHDPTVIDAVVDTNVVAQMIKLTAAIANKTGKVCGIRLPVQEKEQLIDIDAGKIDRIAGPFIGKTDRVAVLQFGAIQFFDCDGP